MRRAIQIALLGLAVYRLMVLQNSMDASGIEIQFTGMAQAVATLLANSQAFRTQMFNELKPEIDAYVLQIVRSAQTPMGGVGSIR